MLACNGALVHLLCADLQHTLHLFHLQQVGMQMLADNRV